MKKIKDWIRRNAKILTGGALALAVVLCITVTVQVLTTGYVRFAGYSVFRVATGSMEPTIPVNAVLICKKTAPEQIRQDDIICFRSRESYMLGSIITHRVIRVIPREDGTVIFETMGDANIVPDGYYVTQDNLVGKVTWYTGENNMLTAVLAFLNHKIGFLACIVFPCLVIAVLVLRECIGNIRREMDAFIQNPPVLQQTPPELTQEEYEQIYQQVKEELLKELKASAEKESK